MEKLRTLQGHISSVRTITTCESGLPWQESSVSPRILLFSAGGRAQLCIWRISPPHIDQSLDNCSDSKCERTQLNEEPSVTSNKYQYSGNHETLCVYMMDHWNKKSRKPWKGQDLKPNPETRFMDISVVSGRDVCQSVCPYHVLMATACSDGFVR